MLKEERDPRVRRNCDTPVQIHKYNYTNTIMQIQICKYKYANTNMQIQICKDKYAKINMQIQICKYMFIPPPTSKTGGFKIRCELTFPLVSPILEPNLNLGDFFIKAATMSIEIFIAELPVEVF